MNELDVRGLSCPMPIMQTKKALEDDPPEILVHADSGTAKANVVALLADSGYEVTVEESVGEYRIRGSRA
ncbi:MAG: sulfurtransferase TusA family protein [Coriobacteriia bacterium]|nr:sulfurtransferase TusA family protein [Coriobacteriia bacterium]